MMQEMGKLLGDIGKASFKSPAWVAQREDRYTHGDVDRQGA